MATRRKAAGKTKPSPGADLDGILATLKRLGSRRTLEEMGPRYGIHTSKAFGVPMAKVQALAKKLGRDHDLATALWSSGWYEARLLAALVEEPARVTTAQMDRWCKDFDNWGVCDTVCFKLFDQLPHALSRVTAWAGRREEFVRRGAFALLACLALHDEDLDDASFVRGLHLIEKAATDDRNFVKKAVQWALRAIGSRNRALHAAAMQTAERLAGADSPASRFVGKGAMRELVKPATIRRLGR